MNYASKLFLTLAASSLLAGCQSFSFAKLGFGKSRPAATMPQMSNQPGFVVLAEGQEQLRLGNISAAVASFRIATLDPDSRADANNGLGIAYAKLGRADLAERYFSMAAMLDPANSKYAANIARLQKAEYLAKEVRDERMALEVLEHDPQVVLATYAAEPERLVTKHVSITNEPTSRITRISRSEVRISEGTQSAAAPKMRVEYAQPKVAPPSEPEVIAQGDAEKTEYPLRVALVSKSKTIRPNYPVRIDLRK